MTVPPPSFVLETALYASDLEAAEWFYHEVFGLEVLFREEGRHVFFRCGPGVLLLFRAEVTRQGNSVPPHGAEGAGHVAFAVEEDRLEAWRAHLAEYGIEVEHDQDWGDRGRSLYLRDPADNSVELATPTLWGTASRGDWLRQIRPSPEVDTKKMDPVERFQAETLRPLLTLLTPTILRLVAEQFGHRDINFATLESDKRREYLQALLEEDEMLRRTLLGTVLGHFTEEELTTYLAHQEGLRPRFFALVLTRLQECTDGIAEHIST